VVKLKRPLRDLRFQGCVRVGQRRKLDLHRQPAAAAAAPLPQPQALWYLLSCYVWIPVCWYLWILWR
jgi:hypothetical protein